MLPPARPNQPSARYLSWLFASGIAAFAPVAALAQTVPLTFDLDVTAPAPVATPVPDTASQGVVTGTQILERPIYRVGESLEIVPGLIVTQHSGEGKANQYFLRGFNLDHGTDIDITLDDMPAVSYTHLTLPTN